VSAVKRKASEEAVETSKKAKFDEDSAKDSDSSDASEEEEDENKVEAEIPKRVEAPKKVNGNSEASNSTVLFVGKLPWAMDDVGLINLFTSYGDVTESRIVYDRDSGRSKG
jgi:RNA recognition motif-containing protein